MMMGISVLKVIVQVYILYVFFVVLIYSNQISMNVLKTLMTVSIIA